MGKKENLFIIGEGLFGGDWIPLLEKEGYSFRKELKSSLIKKYNEEQRLLKKKYKIHILAGNEIEKKQDRTTQNLKRLARDKFKGISFEDLKGEAVFLCRLKISNKEMKEMGFDYISMLHKPFEDDFGDQGWIVFDSQSEDNLYLYYENMNDYWAKNGGFIFLEEVKEKTKRSKKSL